MPLVKAPDIEQLKQDRDRDGLLRALGYKRDAAIRRAAAEALIEGGHTQQVLDAAIKMRKSQAVALLLALLEHAPGEVTRRKSAEALLSCYKAGGLSAQDKQAVLALEHDIRSAVHRDFTGPLAIHSDRTYHVKHDDRMNCFGDYHYDTPEHQAHTDRRHTDTRPHIDLPAPTQQEIKAEQELKSKLPCGVAVLGVIGALLVLWLLSQIPTLIKTFRPSGRAETPTVVQAEATAIVQERVAAAPTATPRPTDTPEIVEQLEPIETPQPTATPTVQPTATPLPTAPPTVRPTRTPLPTPTAEPTTSGPSLVVQTIVEAGSPVLGVALSSDGRLLALGCDDGSVQVWDPTTAQRVHLIQAHPERAHSMALSADGRTLASAGQDGSVRLWDTESGELLHVLEGHSLWVNSVAFAPDGQILASASADRSVRLWDVSSGQALRAMEGHRYWVTQVRFSPDGSQIASASCGSKEDEDAWECARGEIRLWDAVSGQALQTIAGHDGWVRALAFAPDGRTLASGSDDRQVWIWDLDTGQERLILDEHRSWVNGMAYSPDGRWLASVDDGGTLILWDTRAWTPLVQERRHSDYVNDVAFSADGRTLATGSTDGTAIVWSVVGE